MEVIFSKTSAPGDRSFSREEETVSSRTDRSIEISRLGVRGHSFGACFGYRDAGRGAYPVLTFSMHDLDRLRCVQQVIDDDLKPGRAAERLGLTLRQIEQTVIRYRAKRLFGLARGIGTVPATSGARRRGPSVRFESCASSSSILARRWSQRSSERANKSRWPSRRANPN